VRWRRSLSVNLLLWGAGSIAIALVIAGLFILTSFSNSINVERRDDLQASLDRLTAAIDPGAVELAGPEPLTDPRYDTPLSGLYWQIDDLDTKAVVRSRSLWDQQLLPSGMDGGPDGKLSEQPGPNNKRLIVLSRALAVESGTGVRHFKVAVAEARDQDDDPIQRFGLELALALIVLGIVLMLAAGVQVQFGLRPLQTLRQQIASIRQGNASRLPEASAVELEPVVEQINDLLEAQELTIEFARERAADLAHGLKTPLAVISASAERFRAGGDQANADLLEMLAEQMNSRIEYQLRIARLRFRTRARGASSSLNETVLRSVAVLRRSHSGERLNWLVNLEENLTVDIDEHDLMELAGVVLENASKWASTQVRLNGGVRDADVELRIEDDGAGVSDDQIARLGVRGVRLDEAVPGEGLGLAIASEIIRLNHGTFAAERSRLGGLCVRICLPLA
jgi:signal transduction histidine kinase